VRSGELARLAGVTVRALRHYHQVGVLDEPARDTNGYRGYDVHDLVRVLRIKRLAALGIALDRMPALLDGSDEPAGPLLDELDQELATQIDRLTRQRQIVAHLRRHGADPDLPPELAPSFAVFAASGLAPELTRLDRDQTVLLAHLVGQEGMPALADFYARISDPALVPEMTAVVERFARLGPDSSDDDVADLVETFARTLGPVLDELGELAVSFDLGGAAEIFSAHTADVLNARQLQVLGLLEARFEQEGQARDEGRDAGVVP
jgi:DNA-binding transcriptional MerR regulator